ncbi:uncharacterized protein PFL1_05677 [Pseudozyma flocculosa PF-1]|uniref:Outer membrane efflux protein n=1 Tax=Pseudozyma flocculosa PF-1 TaxID=1277687 RepID=A0A061H2L2_9BASI|nr:uncharacterized protein PFL1_05677 [Pseudozyma flocculosa PF-1]EPQ26698.1 hypothetical protein PFL1_05677 [Pseudozyma flocculosa PF-1]
MKQNLPVIILLTWMLHLRLNAAVSPDIAFSLLSVEALYQHSNFHRAVDVVLADADRMMGIEAKRRMAVQENQAQRALLANTLGISPVDPELIASDQAAREAYYQDMVYMRNKVRDWNARADLYDAAHPERESETDRLGQARRVSLRIQRGTKMRQLEVHVALLERARARELQNQARGPAGPALHPGVHVGGFASTGGHTPAIEGHFGAPAAADGKLGRHQEVNCGD